MLVLNTSEPVQEYELPLLTRSGLSEHLTAANYHNIKPFPARAQSEGKTYGCSSVLLRSPPACCPDTPRPAPGWRLRSPQTPGSIYT